MNSVPDTVMVFAAGLGKRMRPVTETMPKPLVKIAGRAMIDHMLDRFAEIGVKRAIVNVHYLADQLERHLAERKKPAIIISDERDKLLDQGGGIKKVLPLIGDNAILHLQYGCDLARGGAEQSRALARPLGSGGNGRPVARCGECDQRRRRLGRRFPDGRRRPAYPTRRKRGGAVRLCRHRHHEAAALR